MILIRATWLLFASHLRQTVLSRRALICLGLGLMPVVAALLVLLIAERKGGLAPILEIGWVLQVLIITPLVSLIIGSSAVAEEVENRTISYLFTRPIPRPAILLGRWLAGLVVITALLALGTWLMSEILERASRGASQAPTIPHMQSRLLQVTVIAGAVYSAVFAAAGACFRRSIIIGLAYTFAIEVFLSILPGGNQKITIQYYLKSYLAADDPAVMERLQHSMQAIELVSPGEALRTLLTILVVALAVGSWAIARKQYVLPS